MCATVKRARHAGWDARLLRASAATGSAPSAVHMERLPGLSFRILKSKAPVSAFIECALFRKLDVSLRHLDIFNAPNYIHLGRHYTHQNNHTHQTGHKQ